MAPLYAPKFIAAPFKINFPVDNAIAAIKEGLDSAIGIENTTTTAKLHAALTSVAVRGNEVDMVLEGPCHPITAGRLVIQPIGGKQNDIRTM